MDHLSQSTVVGDVIPYSLVLHFLFARAPSELKSPHQVVPLSDHQCQYFRFFIQAVFTSKKITIGYVFDRAPVGQ